MQRLRRPVSHATEATWSADETGHWYACADCGEKLSFAAHTPEDGKCGICGYSLAASTEPVTEPVTEPAPAADPEDGETPAGHQAAPTQGSQALVPWWMMIVAGLISSAATVGVLAIVLLLSRKKIAQLFIGK